MWSWLVSESLNTYLKEGILSENENMATEYPAVENYFEIYSRLRNEVGKETKIGKSYVSV